MDFIGPENFILYHRSFSSQLSKPTLSSNDKFIEVEDSKLRIVLKLNLVINKELVDGKLKPVKTCFIVKNVDIVRFNFGIDNLEGREV